MVVYKLTLLHHYISPPQVWALSFAARFDHWLSTQDWVFLQLIPTAISTKDGGFDPAVPDSYPRRMGFSFLAAPETALIHTGWGFDKAAPKQLPNLSKALGWLS